MEVSPLSVQNVTAAIRQAGARTGVSFDYLLKTAQRESSLNPNADAKTSSAAGLFQFIEQTWLGAVKAYGGQHGLGAFADAITRGDNGRLEVANAETRDDIMALRYDPALASAMAGELTGENKTILEQQLGRVAGAADLYAAHFLGPSGAVKLLSSASDIKAADLLPAAAKANPQVFYDGDKARSVGEVVASFARSMGVEAAGSVDHDAVTAQPVSTQKQGVAGFSHADFVERETGRQVAVDTQSIDYIKFDDGALQRSAIEIENPVSFNALSFRVLQLLDPAFLLDRSHDNDKR